MLPLSRRTGEHDCASPAGAPQGASRRRSKSLLKHRVQGAALPAMLPSSPSADLSQYALLRLCFGRAVFLLFITPSVTCGDRFPFLSLRDIFPRRGGSRPSRGRLLATPQSFPLPLKPSPWGRWHGDSRDGRGNFFREKGVQESPQTFLYPKIQITFPLFMRRAQAERILNRPALRQLFTSPSAAFPDSRRPQWPPG